MHKIALYGLPKYVQPTDAHVNYEQHRETSGYIRRQKMDDALRLQSHVRTEKAEEDLSHYKELQHKIPLEPEKVVDEGIIEMHGHLYVEAGLMNKSLGLDKDQSVDNEMNDNVSFINAQSRLRPALDNEAAYVINKITPLEKIAMAEVKPHQQETQWTCSAACLKSVLTFYGIPTSERKCGVYIKVRKNKGAETTDIVNAAKAMGYDSYEKSFTIDEARDLTDKGIPIICDIQSFTKPGAGHYVVLVGIEGDRVYLMDPNTKGNSRTISLTEFRDRWFDHEMKPPHKLMKHWGVVVKNPKS